MSFSYWLREQTGLTLYDFRVLDVYGDSEKQVCELFYTWTESEKPIPSAITEAIEAAADEGFDVFLA